MSEYKVLIIGDEMSGLDLEVRSFDEKPTLKEMQEMVGGYIEFVPIFMHKALAESNFIMQKVFSLLELTEEQLEKYAGAQMSGVINEEGKINGSEPNPIATELYDAFKRSKGMPEDGDWIAGTMFIPINFDID